MHDLLVMLPLGALKPTTAPGMDMGAAGPAATVPSMTAGPAVVGPAATMAGTDATATTTATTQSGAAAIEGNTAKATPGSNIMSYVFMGGMLVLLYFVMFRGPKKAEKARKLLLSSMKKGDKVMTIGGLVARVVSIDEDDVVLKIDESANVKAVFKKSSIQQILDRDDKGK